MHKNFGWGGVQYQVSRKQPIGGGECIWACVVSAELDVSMGDVWCVACFGLGMKEGACGFSFGVSLSWGKVCIFNRALAVSWSDEISSSVSISWEDFSFWTM